MQKWMSSGSSRSRLTCQSGSSREKTQPIVTAERGNRNNTERHRSEHFHPLCDLQFPNSHFAGSFQLSSPQAIRTLQEQPNELKATLTASTNIPWECTEPVPIHNHNPGGPLRIFIEKLYICYKWKPSRILPPKIKTVVKLGQDILANKHGHTDFHSITSSKMTDISQYQDNKDHTKHIEGDVDSVEDPNREQYEPAFIRKTVAKVIK